MRVLSTPNPNVYVRLGDAGGARRVVADDRLDHIREVLPLLAEQITGRPYDGRIESGTDERGDREGWITVRFVTPEEYRTSAPVAGWPPRAPTPAASGSRATTTSAFATGTSAACSPTSSATPSGSGTSETVPR